MSDSVVFHNPMLKDGFAQVPNAVMRDKRLSPQAKCVYTLLLSYAWRDYSCFPSQKTIAADLCVSDRYVRTILKELSQTGFLRIEQKGLNRPNVYHFLDFYASSPERNHSSTPDRNHSSIQERKGSSNQDRKRGSSEEIPNKEYPKKKSDPFLISHLKNVDRINDARMKQGKKPLSDEKMEKAIAAMRAGERLDAFY